MNEWIGLIGALAGTAIGGFVTYKLADQKHAFERAAEKECRLITACESIHSLLSEIASCANTLSIMIIKDIEYSSPLKDNILKEKVQLDRLRMLVDFYTPSLNGDVKAITEQFNIVIKAVVEVLFKEYRTNEWESKTVVSATIAATKITRLVQVTQEKLGQLVQFSLGTD